MGNQMSKFSKYFGGKFDGVTTNPESQSTMEEDWIQRCGADKFPCYVVEVR